MTCRTRRLVVTLALAILAGPFAVVKGAGDLVRGGQVACRAVRKQPTT
jgi:hypothetical protein